MDRRDRIRHDRQQQFVELSRERYKPLYRPYELLTRSDREIAQTIIPSRGMTASGPKPAVCQSTKRHRRAGIAIVGSRGMLLFGSGRLLKSGRGR